MKRVLLVQMPLGSLRWPNLALGLMKASLNNRGISTDVRYFTFDLAERIGLDTYQWIAEQHAFILGGERLFAKYLFQGSQHVSTASDNEYYHDVLKREDPKFTPDDRREYESVFGHIEPFLQHCFESIDWTQYAMVGFSTTFQQTLASLGLATLIKQRLGSNAPRIAFGGSACEGIMGLTLSQQFGHIVDYWFTSEADREFPDLCESLVLDRPLPHDAVIGSSDQPIPLDDLPLPDFDEYFERLHNSPLHEEIHPLLLYETSRGCWWGQSHHCKFCALNGGRIAYRKKSPDRIIDEMQMLCERYGVHQACSTDNILDWGYLKTVMPRLSEAGAVMQFEQELRCDMNRSQIKLLVQAGLAAAQLGIESFSTRILQLIDKGTTALDNLQTLKWLTAAGVESHWNLLYGFPGEQESDYREIADMIPLIVHLTPPTAVGRMRLDRFSPYFENAEHYGLTNVRPRLAYRYVYPFDEPTIFDLAYYFDFDFADGHNADQFAHPMLAATHHWHNVHHQVTLRYWDRDDHTLLITDTRPCATAFQHRLSHLDRRLYLACNQGRTLADLIALTGPHHVEPSQVERSIQRMIDDRILLQIDGHYLALAIETPE